MATREDSMVVIKFIRFVIILIISTAVAPNFAAAADVTACIESAQNILDNPNDIKLSLDSQFLYVADTDNDRIAVLNHGVLVQYGTCEEIQNSSVPYVRQFVGGLSTAEAVADSKSGRFKKTEVVKRLKELDTTKGGDA